MVFLGHFLTSRSLLWPMDPLARNSALNKYVVQNFKYSLQTQGYGKQNRLVINVTFSAFIYYFIIFFSILGMWYLLDFFCNGLKKHPEISKFLYLNRAIGIFVRRILTIVKSSQVNFLNACSGNVCCHVIVCNFSELRKTNVKRWGN